MSRGSNGTVEWPRDFGTAARVCDPNRAHKVAGAYRQPNRPHGWEGGAYRDQACQGRAAPGVQAAGYPVAGSRVLSLRTGGNRGGGAGQNRMDGGSGAHSRLRLIAVSFLV